MDTLSCVGNPSEITWTPREKNVGGGRGGRQHGVANLVQVLGGELELTVCDRPGSQANQFGSENRLLIHNTTAENGTEKSFYTILGMPASACTNHRPQMSHKQMQAQACMITKLTHTR